MTRSRGFQAANPDLTLTINRSDLEQVMIGTASFEELIGSGKATFSGDITILGRLAVTMVEFDPRFEVLPGTAARTEVPVDEPYAVHAGAVAPE